MTSADPSFSAVRYLPTNEAYDRWASVYDTDGNFLQALDDREMKTLLPRFEASIRSPQPWKLVDLGCGTGRNTGLLCTIPAAGQVVGLDGSPGMLAIAERRIAAAAEGTSGAPAVQLQVFDLLASSSTPAVAAGADGIISTLVLEHIPLEIFFSHVSQMLRPGGVLLLTNMHAHMGSISQAGFVDTATGEKIRPTSFPHTVADVVAEAAKWGLSPELDSQLQSGVADEAHGPARGIREVAVTEDLVEVLGPRSKKWAGITCWFGGLFRKTE
ncbi:putative methyltransferase [Xylariales sp. PMI_506]|nr:putative methyltransferase [Xylariales sp. PMI_506]